MTAIGAEHTARTAALHGASEMLLTQAAIRYYPMVLRLYTDCNPMVLR
jgi:hypothetical protein